MKKLYFTLTCIFVFLFSFSQSGLRIAQNSNNQNVGNRLELAQANSENELENSINRPELNQSPFDAVKGKKEDESKRDAYSRHYINDDGSYTAIIGAGPMHYFNLNNGWNTPIAEENIQIMVKKLGFDYYEYKMDWQEFKEIQLAFFKSSIVDLEIPTDLAILGANYEIAKKFKIPSILSGGNFAAEGILPLTWGYHVKSDMKLYKHIVKKYSNIKIKKTPYAGLKENFINKFIRGIKTYYPLNYVNFNKDKAKQFLIENYGFKEYGGKHQESTITGFLQTYLMPIKYNIDYRRATLSSQICTKQISREQALKILDTKAYDEGKIKKDKLYICEKWEITEAEFDNYLKLKAKNYKNFPNQEKFISSLFSLYKKIKS